MDHFEQASQLAQHHAVAMAKDLTANQALGDGQLLALIIELFKTLLPVILELLKNSGGK